MVKRIFAFFVIFLFLIVGNGLPLWGNKLEQNQVKPGSETNTVISENGMVSSTHYLATEAALNILKNGGNAVDAAAVIQFALSVIQPQSTGIGGGCFYMYYDNESKKVVALDGREEAPEKFNGRQFCKNNDCLTNSKCDCSSGIVDADYRKTGGHPVGVPGTVRAIERILHDYGTMTLAEVTQPAINFAYNGFPMYEKLYNEIVNHSHRLKLFPSSSILYLNQSDTSKPICKVGETFKNIDQGKTLELIAEHGSDIFYKGEIAQDIINATQTIHPLSGKYGLMTKEDLENYLPVYREPVQIKYRAQTIYSFPPPSSGTNFLQMFGYLEAFDLESSGQLTVESLHRMIDAQNIGFSDRNKFMGDADFVDVPIQELLDKNYIRQRRDSLTKPFSAIGTPIPPGNPAPGKSEYAVTFEDFEVGTTHWVIVDKQGNGVSFTSTIEENMGSALVVPGRGFLLNNELTDFETFESDGDGVPYANAPEGGKKLRRTALGNDANTYGGKRPRSSMTPTIIFNNTNQEMYLLTGSPGGSSIPGAVFNVIINTLDFANDLQFATDFGRVLAKNGETSAEVEIYETRDGKIKAELEARGFNFSSPTPTTATYGRVQSILRGKDGFFYGAADVKREPQAKAMGY